MNNDEIRVLLSNLAWSNLDDQEKQNIIDNIMAHIEDLDKKNRIFILKLI